MKQTGGVVMTKLGWAAALAVSAVLSVTAADARPWKPSPSAQALDYLQIQHMRPGGEVVVLFWIAPPMIEGQPAAAELLGKYVVLAVVHARPSRSGVIRFDDVPAVKAFDGNGKELHRYTDDDMPSDVAMGVHALSGIMKQSLGAMGEGMKFFVYDSEGVDACKAGKLVVPYADETYTFDTPVPGCK